MLNYRQAGFAVDWCAFRLISPEAQVWIFLADILGYWDDLWFLLRILVGGGGYQWM